MPWLGLILLVVVLVWFDHFWRRNKWPRAEWRPVLVVPSILLLVWCCRFAYLNYPPTFYTHEGYTDPGICAGIGENTTQPNVDVDALLKSYVMRDPLHSFDRKKLVEEIRETISQYPGVIVTGEPHGGLCLTTCKNQKAWRTCYRFRPLQAPWPLEEDFRIK